MRPHLLYLAFFFPPSRASGVYRALATVNAFVEDGWDVTVVTADERFFEEEIGSVDRSLLDQVPAVVEVVRVEFTQQTERLSDLASRGWFAGNYPEMVRLVRARTAPVRNLWRVMRGRSTTAYAIGDPYAPWIEPVVNRSMSLVRGWRSGLVLATGNPFASFEAARLVAGQAGLPYIVDYRDPWTIDVFTGRDAGLPAAVNEAERRIVAEAAACVHVNDAIAAAYADRYPSAADRQHVVSNGYDRDSIGAGRPPAGNGPIRVGMLGTLNDRWPIHSIFGAWNRLRAELPDGSEFLLAGHLGYFARSEEPLRELLPADGAGFRYVGPVRKSEVADFYGGLDVVVVPAPGGAMVTSGKVFEAAAIGVPVLCVQDVGGGARRVLEGHPLAVFAEPEVHAVEVALRTAIGLARDRSDSSGAEARRWAQRYERGAAVAHLVELARQVTPREDG